MKRLAGLAASVLLAIAAAAQRPAILVCSPLGAWDPRVDLQFLQDLQAQGFEPDYLDGHGDFSWDRIKQYNVIVIYGCPAARAGDPAPHGFPDRAPYFADYAAAIQQFLDDGGGIYCLLYTANADDGLRPMIEPWGVRLPLERYRESDPNKVAILPRMRGLERLSLIDEVEPSPVSGGVQQLWFPYGDAYNTSWSAPIAVTGDWQVVVRGSTTSRTEPVALDKVSMPAPEDPLIRADGVARPPLFALREYSGGRIFLGCQWPQFSIGQGTQWLYDRMALSKGAKGIASDYEKLIINTLHWLAEPSLRTGGLGGFTTPPGRLDAPNRQTAVRAQYVDRYWRDEEFDAAAPAPHRPLFRGLIGARSAVSGGSGTIAEYAAAAKAAGLQFLVFLEDGRQLDRQRLAALSAACRQHSDDEVLLLPGYAMDTNIGNHMFFYGPDVAWPTDVCLTGEDRRVLNWQYQDESGAYVMRPVVLSWILAEITHPGNNAGVFNFDQPRAMKLPDLKLCAAVGLYYYHDGQLVEDRTADYLATAQGTIAPTPVAINLVHSPAELTREVSAGRGLTFAQARDLAHLMPDALRWSHQYDAMNVFPSTGPQILAWPQCFRAHVYGGEPFVLGREVVRAELHVTAAAGLQELVVYNGTRVFRRFLCHGAESFRQLLQLPGNVYRNLVLVATDVAGGKAVSFPARIWKEGAPAPVFCGDHINDCGAGYLARGPGQFRVNRYPDIFAGQSWDGGPIGVVPIADFQGNHPVIQSNLGSEGDRLFNNLPVLETADDQALVVRSLLQEVYDPAVPAVNPWHTSGPIDPSRLITCVRRYREFNRPALHVVPNGWAAQPVRTGAVVACYDNEIAFRQTQTVERLRLFRCNWTRQSPFLVAVEAGAGCEVTDATADGGRVERRVAAGGWFGFYSPRTSNSVLFVNRGEAVRLLVHQGNPSTFVEVFADGLADVAEGDVHRYSLASVSDSLDVAWKGPERFFQLLRYLREAPGVSVLRGQRQPDPLLFAVTAADGVVELQATQPPEPVEVTLPVEVAGLNPNWSAGLYQIVGHTPGEHTNGRNVYTALGFDFDGHVHAAVYPDQAPLTHIVVGHPLVCDQPELIIEAMPRLRGPDDVVWRVAVNNPTAAPLTATLRQAMSAMGLSFSEQQVTVAAGGWLVLQP